MAERNIKKNYIFNLSYQILNLLVPLISLPYLSRILGADGIGTYSYTESVCSYFVLFANLGLTTFGQREISYAQGDKEKRSIVFWETIVIQIISTVITIVAYVFFSFTHSNWQNYLVLTFNLIGTLVNITWFFQGMEQFGLILLRNVICKVASIIFIFIFVKKKEDVILYLLVSSLSVFLNNGSFWINIKKYVGAPNWSKIHPFRHLKSVISLFIPTVAIQVYTVLDKTMIGLITHDSFENGYYEQAVSMSRVVLTIVTSLGAVMVPCIGNLFEKGDKCQIKAYIYSSYRFVWFLGLPLCFGLISVSSNFIPWFYGDGYEPVIQLIGILSFLIIAIGINNVTGIQYLIPTKREKVFTKTVIYGAITNLILNSILIPLYKSTGAAIASIIAETVIAVVQIYFVRKELSVRIIIKSGFPYLFSSVIMASFLMTVKNSFASTISNTIILVFIGAFIYISILFLIHDEFFYDNIVKVVKQIFHNITKGFIE